MDVFVTADDFGRSSTINQAVVAGVESGCLSHASIMANGDAFREGCELAVVHGFAERVGLHFNLTDGKPLSWAMASCPRFCQQGQFVSRMWTRVVKPLSAHERKCLVDEL